MPRTLLGRRARAAASQDSEHANLSRLLRDPPGGPPTAERFRLAAAFRRLETELLNRASLLERDGEVGRVRHRVVELAQQAERSSVQAVTGARPLSELRADLADLSARARRLLRREARAKTGRDSTSGSATEAAWIDRPNTSLASPCLAAIAHAHATSPERRLL